MKESLQQKWAFVQSVNPGIGEDFRPVEEALQHSFLPKHFRGNTAKVLAQVVTRLQVNQAGLALLKTTLSASENWWASCVVLVHLVTYL